jgi:predicted GTPase
MVTETKPKPKPKIAVKRVVVDKQLKHRLTQAERQLKAMKDRKAKKSAKKAMERNINRQVKDAYELIDQLSSVLVTHGKDQL